MKIQSSYFEIVLFLILVSNSTYSQASKQSESENKLVFHTIDVEAFSIGYTISQKLSNKGNFGFGLQLGASYRYFLNNPTWLFKSTISDTVSYTVYESVKLKPAVNSSIEIAQIKFFYRYSVFRKGYINMGAYLGYGILGGGMDQKGHVSYGALCDLFWGFEHLKLGSRLQIGNTHITYNAENKTNIFSVLLTPIVIQFCF